MYYGNYRYSTKYVLGLELNLISENQDPDHFVVLQIMDDAQNTSRFFLQVLTFSHHSNVTFGLSPLPLNLHGKSPYNIKAKFFMIKKINRLTKFVDGRKSNAFLPF